MKLTRLVAILPAVAIIAMTVMCAVFVYANYAKEVQQKQLERTQDMMDGVLALRSQINSINTAAYKTLVMSGLGFSETEIEALSQDQIKKIKSLVDEVSALRLKGKPEEQAILENIQLHIERYSKSASAVFDMVVSDPTYGTQLMGASEKDFAKALVDIVAFYDSVNATNKLLTQSMEDDDQKRFFVVIGVVVFSMIALLLIAGLVIRNIHQRSNTIVERIQKMVDLGHFSEFTVMHGNDEFAKISSAFSTLIKVISQAVNEVNKVVEGIAQGDYTQRVNSHFVGDLLIFKQGINASAESVAFMMSELEKVMTGLQQGNLSIQMDAKVPADFRHSVDVALGSINQIVSDINQIMQRLNDGNFDARVNANAQGDLLQMKQAVNGTLDTLEQLVDELVRMAKAQMEGDLTVVSQGTYKGRFKELQDARAASTARITEVVTLALQASHVVSDAASQVSQGSSDLSSRVQEQAAALEQTSATMHQMTSAVQANTENASKVAELAHQVQGQSNDGVQVMQQTIEAMKSIQQASNKIADIVSIIDSIAFQTNLLALNAAVEAARAGEHGRGFAVVASEVRALAGKSADAAKDIKGLIEDSVQRIDAGTKLADKSGEMLSTISESVKEVANMIEAISSASKEQTTGISQVHLAIADIDRVTQENAALVEETTAAAESLNHEANELRQNMSFFKTGQNNHSMARKAMPSALAAKGAPNRQATQALPSPKSSGNTDEWNEF